MIRVMTTQVTKKLYIWDSSANEENKLKDYLRQNAALRLNLNKF